MKKIKFMFAALLAMLSVNSYAIETAPMHRLIDNVVYYYDKAETAAEGEAAIGTVDNPFSAYVEGVKGTELTTVNVQKTVSFKNDLGDDVYLNVVGFQEGWAGATTTLGTSDVKATLKTLTIDGTNLKTADGLNNAFGELTALENLTVAAPMWVNASSLTGRLNAAVKKTLKTLDISGMSLMTEIGEENFKGYEALETIVLPANLKTIGASAFVGTALNEITIPAKVTSIGASAFEGIETLAAADLSGAEALKTIGEKAFGHTAVATVVIPAAVTSIGDRAFESNKSLESVTINAELTTIPAFCFQGCSALTAITLPETLTAINKNAFNGTGLTTIDIPETVTSIGVMAFNACEALESVTGMEGVTVLENRVFNGCTKLASIALSEEITSVGNLSLAGTKIVELNLPNCTTFNDAALGKAVATRAANKTLQTVVLGAADIDPYTFANCTALTTVTWDGIPADGEAEEPEPIDPTTDPADDGSHEEGSYSGTRGIEIPNNSVSENAFYGCTGLKNFNYLNGEDDAETEVGAANVHENAFIGCTQFVNFNTSYNYVIAAGGEDAAPLNTKFVYTEPAAETVTITTKVASGNTMGYMPWVNNTEGNYFIDPVTVKGVYSVYTVNDISYFQGLRVRVDDATGNAGYIVAPGNCIVIKTEGSKEVTLTLIGEAQSSVSNEDDNMFVFKENTTLAALQSAPAAQEYWSNYGKPFDVEGETRNALVEAGYPANNKSIYRLINSASGIGFSLYTGSTLKAGQFFVLGAPTAEGRLQVVWLDENGIEESNATAIQSIETETEDGAAYNLAGQKVGAGYKGLVIKNGKKMMK